MTIKWLIQDSQRMYSALEDEFTPLSKLGYDIIPYGLVPMTTIVTGLEELDLNDTFIIRGGTKIIDILVKGESETLSPEVLLKMRAGISYDRTNFDQAYYSTLGLPLLNDKPQILDLRESNDLFASFDVPKFVKPSSDLKAFTAGILEPGKVLKNFIESNYHRENYAEETVIVHDALKIDAEYRFICIDGKVITGSQYQKNGRLILSSEIPRIIQVTADVYANLYKPSEIYTMDLAETPNGIKIVEYNCWNCSGLYHMDSLKLFSTIKEYYEGKI